MSAIGATLVGVMVMIAINTANWESIRGLRRIPKSDTAVMLLTVVIAVLTHNLAVGLLSGVALGVAVVVLLYPLQLPSQVLSHPKGLYKTRVACRLHG